MKNFLRVVRLTLQRRATFAGAVACSLGIAVFYGGNLALLNPTIEIVFADRPPHALVQDKVAKAQEALQKTDLEAREIAARVDAAPAAEKLKLQRQHQRLVEKRGDQERALWWAEYFQPVVERLLPNSTFAALALLLALFVVATLIKDTLLVGNLVLVERLTQLAMLDMRNEMFHKTLQMEMSHFGEGHSSHIIHRMNGDVNCDFNGVNVVCGRFILEPLKMIVFLGMAAYLCWKLLLVSLLVAPLAVYVMVRLTRSLRKANKRDMEEMGLLYTLLAETLTNIQTVKVYGMERFERRRYRASGRKYYGRAMRIIFFNALGRASGEFLGMTMICIAIGVGAYLMFNPQATLFGVRIMNQQLSFASLMTFYGLLVATADPARKLSEVTGILQRGIAAADRVYELLDRQPTVVDPPRPKLLTAAQPELHIDHVSFQYATGQRILHEIDLRIPFGQSLAIVGPNGCGKTTLVNLLPRFYDPVEGVVRLDGIDVRDLRLKSLRRMTSFVAQQAMLFDDTVLNNIRYGSPQASEAAVCAAAEKAFAHRFIVERLPKGYQTVVGERGGRLSGGQRQRILLARAILRDPQFLVLDEATSQIDLESEQLIHKVLEQFIRGRTTLMITHRMSSIALADRIVVMDDGRIIDSGKHGELLGRCQLYARLHSIGFQQAA